MTTDIGAIAADYTAAWNSGSAKAVASFFAPEGNIVINRGTAWEGRAGIAAMAAGFFADVPDLSLTLTAHHAQTHNPLRIIGWEEWDLDSEGKVTASRGWYDAADHAFQVAG